ncbi:hypothetical protein EBU99_05655 [bacterium]|nr:hypothetical protein [bacterium]
MNSEFPMTFADTSKDSKAVSNSNVIPLSRAADSQIAHSNLAQLAVDYPMSEFDESLNYERSSERKPLCLRRKLFRALLISVLAGLWAAIATGHLSSEAPQIAALRSMLNIDLDEVNSEIPAPPTPVSAVSSQVSEQGAKLVHSASSESSSSANTYTSAQNNNSSFPAEGASAEKAQAPSALAQQTMEVLTAAQSQAVQSQANVEKIKQPAAVPAIPSTSSLADIEKMAALLSEQQGQFAAMESHMVLIMNEHASFAATDKFLADLEKKHQNALKLLKEQRRNLRRRD